MKNKLILLDLDNTLICAEDLALVNNETSDEGKSKMRKARETFRTVRMEDYYDIFERPHLQEFLDYLFENFDVGVWTASSKDYAIFVIKHFITEPENHDRGRKVKIFLCSHHCNVSRKHTKGITKDLKLISDKWGLYPSSDKIILIDDLEILANHQPNNVITVKPFFYDKEEAYSDTELLKVKEKLKEFVRKN